MDLQALQEARDLVWLYLAGPTLGLVGLILTVRLRAPQWRLLGRGLKALRARPRPNTLAPGLATVLTTVGAMGAAGAVGAATAVSLGGPGVLPYLWLFGILMGPLAYAETWLARTDAPGKSDVAASGSLTRRLRRMGDRWRIPSLALTAALLVTGFAFAGGVHGRALADATERLLPGSTLVLVGGAAAVGALLVITAERTRSVAGWLGLAGLLVLAGAAIAAMVTNFADAAGVLARAFSDAFEGAPRSGEFTGAFAGEIAFAATLHLLPPIGATTGTVGAIHALAGGKSRDQSTLALLAPFFYAVVATLLVVAFVGTGVFGTRYADRRPLLETRIHRVAAASAAQRAETDRLYDGLVRIMEGRTRNPALSIGTPRGMVATPLFEIDGEPADIALRVEDGVPYEILKPGRFGALTQRPFHEAYEVDVVGDMLPTGAGLLLRSMSEGAGDLTARFALAGLLALATVAFAVWGWALGRSLPTPARGPRLIVGLLPAGGAALTVATSLRWLPVLGSLAAGVTAVLVALVLLGLSKEVAERTK